MALTGKTELRVRGIKPVETFFCHLQTYLNWSSKDLGASR